MKIIRDSRQDSQTHYPWTSRVSCRCGAELEITEDDLEWFYRNTGYCVKEYYLSVRCPSCSSILGKPTIPTDVEDRWRRGHPTEMAQYDGYTDERYISG